MSTPPSGIAGVFDRAADTYDAVGVDWFTPIARGLVAELAPAAGEHALDIGCGRGAALLPLASAVGPSGHVLGIDLSPRMVAATAADVADRGNVDVQVADAAAPGLAPSSYDVIASSLVLFFLRDPLGALRAWGELLVPGGRLGAATFGTQDPRWRAVDDLFTPHLPPGLLDARTSGSSGPFASDDAMQDLFLAAGLVDVRTARLTVLVTFATPDKWLEFSWSHGQRAMWEAVAPERRPDVERAAFELLGRYRAADGRITLSQDVRYTIGRRP